ncbi:hypothetical protein ACLKA6_016150 [Drosophila palustris]
MLEGREIVAEMLEGREIVAEMLMVKEIVALTTFAAICKQSRRTSNVKILSSSDGGVLTRDSNWQSLSVTVMKLDNAIVEADGSNGSEGSRLGFINPVLDDVLKADAGETERRGVEVDFGLSTDLKEPFVSEGVREPDGIEEAEERRAVLAVGTVS